MVPSSPSPSWHELPGSARFFISAVCGVGGGIIAYSLPVAIGPHQSEVLALAFATIPVSMVKASLPHGVSTLTLCLVLDCLTLLLLGPQAGVLVAAVGAWGQCTFRNRLPNPVHQTLFSVSSLVCAMLVAGLAYISLGGHPGAWEPSTMIVPFVVAVTTYFLINSGLIATAIGLSTCQSAVRIWSDSFLGSWPSHLLGAAVAAATFSGIRHGGLWLVAFLAVPLALTVRNLQVYFERFHESLTDSLTGLPNQRFVLQHAAREIARAKRRRANLAIILVDLDGFKAINDTLGHRAGDNTLCRVARCLQQSVRPYDVCARYGGDEFLIVVSDCDSSDAAQKGEELRTAVRAVGSRLLGKNVPVAISVGTAVCPEDGQSLEQLLEAADARMYRNKPGARAPVLHAHARVRRTTMS